MENMPTRTPTLLLFPLLYTAYHILTLLFLSTHLPTLSPILTTSLALYSLLATTTSIAGMYGLRLRSPTLLRTFAHHLHLDCIVSIPLKLIVAFLFHNFSSGLCGVGKVEVAYDVDRSYNGFKAMIRDDRAGFAVEEAGRIWRVLVGERNACQIGMSTADVAFVLCLLGLSVAQWRTAVGMRAAAEGCEARVEADRVWDEKVALYEAV